MTSWTWPYFSGTLEKEKCPMYTGTGAYTRQVTLYKLPEKQCHVYLVTLYEGNDLLLYKAKHFCLIFLVSWGCKQNAKNWWKKTDSIHIIRKYLTSSHNFIILLQKKHFFGRNNQFKFALMKKCNKLFRKREKLFVFLLLIVFVKVFPSTDLN